MVTPPYIPTHDDDILLPIGRGSEAPSPSSSSWSGPCASGPSFISFHSSTATDPIWHEPEGRLQRFKERVSAMIRFLQKKGKEGMDIIQQQPVRVQGYELLMSDQAPLPNDLVFWKETLAYLRREGNEKFSLADDRKRRLVAETAKPKWILDWMRNAEVAQNSGRLDHTKEEEVQPTMDDGAHEKPSPRERPVRRSTRRHTLAGRQVYDGTATTLEETQRGEEHERRGADTAAEADQGQTTLQEPICMMLETKKKGKKSTLKRPRLESSSRAVETDAPPASKRQRQQSKPPIRSTTRKRQLATERGLLRVIDKREIIAAVAEDQLGSSWVSVERRDVCGPKAKAQTDQPLRRSLRIAARRKANENRA